MKGYVVFSWHYQKNNRTLLVTKSFLIICQNAKRFAGSYTKNIGQINTKEYLEVKSACHFHVNQICLLPEKSVLYYSLNFYGKNHFANRLNKKELVLLSPLKELVWLKMFKAKFLALSIFSTWKEWKTVSNCYLRVEKIHPTEKM